MFNFIRYKILNKKWLNFCLLTGVILLSSFLCVYPMFKEGSLDRMLDTKFSEYIEKRSSYPATVQLKGDVEENYLTDVDTVISYVDAKEDKWRAEIDCPIIEKQQIIEIISGYCQDLVLGGVKKIKFAYIEDMWDHVELKYGCKPEDAENSDNELVREALANGAVPCVVSQSSADSKGYAIGEVLRSEVYNTSDNSRDYAYSVIVGVIEEKDEMDSFWQSRLNSFDEELFFDKDGFNTLMDMFGGFEVYYIDNVILNHTYINSRNAEKYLYYLGLFRTSDTGFSSTFEHLLFSYRESKKAISVILFTFEIPIVALLLLFIYMISGQILEMETGEIAMLKSRGVSRIKVIGLYLIQSFFITLTGSIIGIPIGYLFCKLGASTNAFLVFSFKDTSIYRPNLSMLIFAAISFGLSMLFMTIPVIPLSRFTIIERRSRKNSLSNKAFWEKFFLDIPLVLLASYLLFNYSKQKASIAEVVISGGNIDPVIFLDSSLFILGCGLFALRLIHIIVKLVYKIGKNKWKPDEYVAFLQIIRSSKRQGFISVFLVMTIAMGIFNSNLARSVNENMEMRTEYNVGCDAIVAEKWGMTVKKNSSSSKGYWKYTEPDIKRFDKLEEYGVVSYTKVLKDTNTDFISKGQELKNCTLMGINSKEFGNTIIFKDGLNEEHINHYLNALASNPKGVLISKNIADHFKLKVGDRITYARYSPLKDSSNPYAECDAQIVGIIDSFPGYQSVSYKELANGKIESTENYLIVANYGTVVNAFNTRPYEVWMKFSKNVDAEEIRNYLKDNKYPVTSFTSKTEEINAQRNSTLIQITNGMFSIGFVISLTVCAVGFLIYWILTIRERELIYGIYRSMGLTMKEVFRMLIVEQIFSSLLACVGGFGVGMLTTFLFTKLIAIVYLPREHNIPFTIMCRMSDMMKMGTIVGIVLIVCFIVIYRIIKSMNITKAIKLGED